MATATLAKPAAARPSQSANLVRGAVAALVFGLLFLAAAGSVAIGFVRSAYLEQAADDGWPMIGCEIIGERTGQNVLTTDADGNVSYTQQLQPQIEVKYVLDGVQLQTWVDVPCAALNADVSAHHSLAQRALGRFNRGDMVACYANPDDSSSLRMAQSDGGRRTAITGFLLAGILCFPACGLLLTSWLLRRAVSSNRRVGPASGASAGPP